MISNESYTAIKENRPLKKLFFILFGLVTVSIFYVFRIFFWPFLFALILYIALRPVHDRMKLYLRYRSLCSTLLLLVVILALVLPFFYLLFVLTDQILQFYHTLGSKLYTDFINEIINNQYISRLLEYFNVNSDQVINNIVQVVQQKAGLAFANLTRLLSFPLSFSVNLAFMLLILFFLLNEGYKLDTLFYRILPFPDEIERVVVNRIKTVVKVLLAGNLFMMSLQGLMVGIAFVSTGLQMPLLWGIVSAIVSLIPVGGTIFVWLPAAVYLLVAGSLFQALFLSCWCLFWFVFLENIVKPKVFGDRLNFHPLILFFLLLGSIQTFNLPGVIIGPLLLTLFHSFWEIYRFLEEFDVKGNYKKEEDLENASSAPE